MGVDFHTGDKHAVPMVPTQHGQPSDRKFIPAQLYGEEFDLDSNRYDGAGILHGDENFTLVPCPYDDPCKHCGRKPQHLGSIIVAIDGACRGNGTPNAQSSIGVFFAACSQHNISARLDDPAPTSQKAELMACWAALRKAEEIKETLKGARLGEVVVKADSEYLVKGMTEWIFKWKMNGYKTAKGVSVTNAALFQAIDAKVTEMNGDGIEVLFWHVPRARNEEADELANAAFG